jgi:hypothetical protein
LKRLNYRTGEPFKFGDKNTNGKYFMSYDMSRFKDEKYFYEWWADEDKFLKEINRGRVRARSYQQTPRGHFAKYKDRCKARAKELGIPFDLDIDYLENIATDECPIFKTKFVWGLGRGCNNMDQAATLDRIIPELGYVKGNVVFISHLANRIKNNATEVELYAVADWLHDKRKEVLNVKTKPAT